MIKAICQFCKKEVFISSTDGKYWKCPKCAKTGGHGFNKKAKSKIKASK